MDITEVGAPQEDHLLDHEISSLNHLIDDLLPMQIMTNHIVNNEKVLYEILDEVPNGRKSMNKLFYSNYVPKKGDVVLNSYPSARLQTLSTTIANEWLNAERQSISQMNSSTLQIEEPILFSWREKSQGTKDSRGSVDGVDEINKETPTVRQITNHVLFKKASAQIKKLSSEIRMIEPTENGLAGDRDREIHRPKILTWANPDFHVDPLQTFVATKLPKSPKNEPKPEKRNSTKRRSLFGFWSGRRKKDKEKLTDTKERGSHGDKQLVSSTSNADIDDLSAEGQSDKKTRATELESAGSTQHSGNKNLEFELDVLVYKNKNEEQEEPGEQLEQGKKEEKCDQRERCSKSFESDRTNEIDRPNVNSEDDHEFGDFEQASELLDQESISRTNDHADYPSFTAATHMPSLQDHTDSPVSMDSFVLLQPKKKAVK
ncbi:hypothetical protein HG535_0D05480 [Zygotorulaspora mrakii]|uniref:Uncharacterized protein n=1 Tax=Zygotorulaspora mrakii TaxID=42260 RepID=A0A7H9B4E0_ZYGMR|nr:uncharacterized protein HG535_0D05480 [Zygotorulaspora mrakii]QLG72839.1 hypothetical protein HG535_0D05480 [Zygotorulaspora mrakii]